MNETQQWINVYILSFDVKEQPMMVIHNSCRVNSEHAHICSGVLWTWLDQTQWSRNKSSQRFDNLLNFSFVTLQEHKTDEMHTALMEASMDGHVEVARLLLDSGAQVNMPADSFESPLTLAACGGEIAYVSVNVATLFPFM